MEVPTKEQLKKKKVVELRAELSKLHLPQSGVKDDLIKRLICHYKEAVEQEAAKNKPVSDNQEDLSAEETSPTDVVMIEPAQDEVMETEDSAMVVEQPPPTVVEQPPPTVLEQPPPIVMMQPPPTVVEQPPPTVLEQPPPTVLEQLSPTVVEQPPPTVVEQPPPIVVRQPPPTVVEQPPPAKDPLSQVTSDYYSAADSSKEESVREKSETAKVQEPSTPVATEEKGKKKKKKKRRRRKHDQPQPTPTADVSTKEIDVKIEYVQEDILQPDDPNYNQFHKIFEAFKMSEMPELPKDPNSVSELVAKAAEASKKLAQQRKYQPQEEEEDDDEEEGKDPVAMTKKKLRKLNRLTVAQLKQLVERPDVVEMHDVTALDPKLLIHLKSTRNTVPVPRHWCFKRKYLQGKRGIEKPPFHLPDFIKATGVMEMRETQEEKDDAKSLKQKARERIRPKMGKLTIDYQKLHDAFFKFQTKPKMSSHGELYYEGKEFETRLRQKKPGDLSDELRRSLGMPIGMGKQKFPPPWLVAMQRYGPPPSYPHLKILGLNAPIPEGCSFGYFVGGWGKPPVDEGGRPLYGDVFGIDTKDVGGVTNEDDEALDKAPWGELESEEEESEEDSSEDEAESPKPEDIQAGLVTPMEGLVTPSGITSIPAGLETPEMIQLRKKKIEEAMEAGGETPALYTVLPEKTAAVGGAMMGSSHVYDLGAAAPGVIRKSGPGGEGVEVALDPSELDLDTATMSARYDEQMKDKNVLQKEDLSDMVAEHAAKQKKRKRAATDSGGKASKKLKEFKF